VARIDEWLEPEKLILLEGWARDGLTKEQIAHNIGIGRTTLFEWEQKEPNIANMIKKGKEVADYEVENALYKKCLGYNTLLKKTFKLKRTEYSADGKKIKEYEELVDGYEETHIPADTTAQIFWLKNRKKEQWRDKVEYSNVSSETNNQIQNIANLLNNPKPNRSEEDVQ